MTARLSILTLQSAGGNVFLRGSITSSDVVLIADDWEDFSRRAEYESWDTGIVQICSDHCVARLVGLSRRPMSTALVASVPLDSATVRRVAALARQSDINCLVTPFPESPSKFRETLVGCSGYKIGSEFFQSLSASFIKFPIPLEDAVRQLIAQPERFQSAGDLALVSNLSRLTCYRHLQRAGLRSPRRLFVAARLLRFYVCVSKYGQSVMRASGNAGYGETRLLSAHCQTAFGVLPRALKHVASGKVVDQLRSWVVWFDDCSHNPKRSSPRRN